MKLVGAKEFLKKAKSGMFFLQFWTDADYCQTIINKYEKNKFNEILDDYKISNASLELYIYGDNSGSLSIDKNYETYDDYDTFEINGKSYHCLCYTDINIIGDASPYETLYLLFDNVDEIFDCVIPNCLTKEELLIIRDWFLRNNTFTDEVNDEDAWALKSLENDADTIVNYR